MWLLLIEDEERLSLALKEGLLEEGYVVDVASDGVEGEELALTNAYDLLIVDWRLPKRDGRSVVERLRAGGRNFPILMLTALADLDHRVAGLDAGADDYLPKPFKFEELLARVRALMRRPPLAKQESVLRFGHLEMDCGRREVKYHDTTLDLRPKHYAFLEFLLRNSEQVVSRTVIAERVWGHAFYVTDNVIDVTVSSLRQEMNRAQLSVDKGQRVGIETIRGVGYRLTEFAQDE